MDELLSEKEQIEAMRAWWQENGRYVISGVVLGAAILVGWNRWQNYQQTTRLEASATYETLAGYVAESELDDAEASAADLYENYASTTYASLGRLAMAKLYMDKGRDQDAAETLSALLASRGDAELQMVARLRLAKVYLYQGKPKYVIELLSGYEDSSFSARYDELLGDAHAELGQFSEANAAYERAMQDDPSSPTVNRTLVQMKLVDLPDVAETDTGTAEPEAAADEGQ